ISADSHIVEPGNLWLDRADKQYRDRVPRIISRTEGDVWWFDDGVTWPLPGLASPGDWENRASLHMRVSELRPAVFDPMARIVEVAGDGVGCEVLYPSFAMRLFAVEEPAFEASLMRA